MADTPGGIADGAAGEGHFAQVEGGTAAAHPPAHHRHAGFGHPQVLEFRQSRGAFQEGGELREGSAGQNAEPGLTRRGLCGCIKHV